MNIYTFIFEYDKFRHFLVSLLIFLIIFYIRTYRIKNKGFFKIISYTIRDVLVIGLFKEFIDLFGFGNPEITDLLADYVGIILPIYIYYIIKEGEKIDNSKFIKHETYLIEILKQKILSVGKKTYILLKIKYEQLFYKKRIIQALQNRIIKYYFLNSIKELFKISKIFLEYTMIWLINMVILTFKIPYLALIDTYKLFFKSFNFGYNKLMKIGN